MPTSEMNGKNYTNGDGVHTTASSGQSRPSIPSEAKRILLASLIEHESLSMPAAVIDIASRVTFTPEVKSFLPTPMKMSESASAIWACIGLFANAISMERYNTASPKKIVVDVYSATLMLCSVFLFTVDGKTLADSPVRARAIHLDKGAMRETYRSVISNIYKTADNRYYHLHGSLNADHTLNMLGLPHHRPDLEGKIEASKDIYRATVAEGDSMSLEMEANERWLQPGVTCLTIDEYAETSHGKLQVEEPLYKIYKTQGQLPPTSWPQSRIEAGARPLEGIKVLDLTKVIAGPTITRVLAFMGADVLRVSSNTQPEAVVFIGDGQIGKRDTDINIKTPEGKVQLEKLLQEADVVVNSYRPGVFEKYGLGRNWAHELARRRGKGIVYCRENCYGWSGEWSHRAGYQQISDCVTGAAWEQGKFHGLNEPVMPLFPNSDTQTGLTGGLAVMHALLRRSSEGGCYNVDVSLNQFNNWLLRNAGLHDKKTQMSLHALHPGFLPRHDTGIFEMVPMVMHSTKKSNGSEAGELWDRARFTSGAIRWGQADQQASYLDWRRIISIESENGKPEVLLDFESASCMPGSDEAKWLPSGANM